MKVVKTRVQVNTPVINNELPLGDYIRLTYWPEFFYGNVFGPWVSDGKLVHVLRKYTGTDQLDIYFIATDAQAAQDLKVYLEGIVQFGSYIISGPDILIWDDAQIATFIADTSDEYSRDSYSPV